MAGPGKNYTLGRGKLFFDQFARGTQNLTGERYIGNTPEWSANIETENLDHYSSDEGIREKDESIALQTNRTAAFTTDNIDANNIAYFFFGETSAFAVTAATVTAEKLFVRGDRTYTLGKTATNPVGARALDVHTPGSGGTDDVNIVVKGVGGGAVTYDEVDDYTIDMNRARVYIVPGGAIDIAQKLLGPNVLLELEVDYKRKASSRNRILSGSKPVEGALHYVANNPVGENYDWYMPYVKLSPAGDYNLKGDEWQTIPFSVEILKLGGLEALYIDGEALVA